MKGQRPKGTPDLEFYERNQEPETGTGDSARALGILAGLVSGLAMGAWALLGPALKEPMLGLLWMWLAWPVAIGVALFVGFIVGGFVHHVLRSRAARNGNPESSRDLRDL